MDLDRTLFDVGSRLEYPTTPPLAARVEHAITTKPRITRPRRSWLRPALALGVLIIALVLAIPTTRSTVASWLGVGGVEIQVGEVAELAGDLDLGRLATLDEAQTSIDFSPPTRLGRPDEVYLDEDGRPWLVYAPNEDLPAAAATGIGALVTVFDGVTIPGVLKEVQAGQAVTLEIDGQPAIWIEGGPHTVFLIGRDGELRDFTGRLAGNTLLWQSGAVTYRLELAAGLDAATAIAESLTE